MSEVQTEQTTELTAPVETAPEEQELTIEDLFNEGIEEENVKQAEKEMLLPVGTYTTTPPFTINKMGKDKNGRPFARYYGEIILGEVKGRIGVGLSWVRKNAVDFETKQETEKPDRAYKNYVMAVKAFRAAYTREPQNVGEVLAYLRDYPVRLRVIQTSDGENMVVSISAVRG